MHWCTHVISRTNWGPVACSSSRGARRRNAVETSSNCDPMTSPSNCAWSPKATSRLVPSKSDSDRDAICAANAYINRAIDSAVGAGHSTATSPSRRDRVSRTAMHARQSKHRPTSVPSTVGTASDLCHWSSRSSESDTQPNAPWCSAANARSRCRSAPGCAVKKRM
jgi:hypothetical protein